MPSCVVKSCKNNSTSKKKAEGITFHRFPKYNDVWKNDWVEIIRTCRNENGWTPSSTSVICSAHFEESDLYNTKKGRRRVVLYAVPKKFLFDQPNKSDEHLCENNISSALLLQSFLIRPMSTSIDPLSFEQCKPPTTTSSPFGYIDIIIDPTNIKEEPADITEEPTDIKEEIIDIKEKPLDTQIEPLSRYDQANIPNAMSNLTQNDISPNLSTTVINQPPTTDTPTNEQILLKKLIRKQTLCSNQKKKIKILNQKIRRLQDRNKHLKYLLNNVRKLK